MSKEKKLGGQGGPAGAPKGGFFRVEVHQPEIIYQIIADSRVENFIGLSQTGINDQVLYGERTLMLPLSPSTPSPVNIQFFALESDVRLSQEQPLRPDEGYYNEERIKRVQQIIEELGSRTTLRRQTHSEDFRTIRNMGFLLIENNGVFVDVNFGFPSRKVMESTRLEDVGKKRMIGAVRAYKGGPPYLELQLKGNRPELGTTVGSFESEGDFINQLLTYAKIYEHLIKAIYAEQEVVSVGQIILHPPILDQDSLTEFASIETKDPAKIAEEQAQVEKFSFDDIAGQDEAIREAKRLVLAINNPEVYEKRGAKRPKGILFYGPPGTGKTLLAKIIAQEANADFVSISAADIGSKWYGESENLMQEVFDRANERAISGKKVVIFFDEIEALAPRRQELTHEATVRVLSVILQNMDGMKSNPNITVIAATNRPDMIDPALKRPGRFDKMIEVGLPGEQGRSAILVVHLEKAKRRSTAPAELFADIDLQEVGKATPGMSGADLENLVNSTIVEKTMAELEGQAWAPITTQDLIDAIKKVTHQKEEKRKLGFST